MWTELGTLVPSSLASLYEVGRVIALTMYGPSHGVANLWLASLPFQYHVADHKETFLNIFVVVPS
jgi:hypothetical protein